MESRKTQAEPAKIPANTPADESGAGGSENLEVFKKELDSFFVGGSKGGIGKTQPGPTLRGDYSKESPASGSSDIITGENKGDMNFPRQQQQSGRNQASIFSEGSENPGIMFQKVLGKFISNTKTLGKQVLDNASSILPSHDHGSSPSVGSHNREISDGNKPNVEGAGSRQSGTSPSFNQTAANVIEGLGRNIKAVGENVFGQFSNAVLKNDRSDPANRKSLCNDITIIVEYDLDSTQYLKNIREHTRYLLSSQTRFPHIISHIDFKFMPHADKDASRKFSYMSCDAAIAASKSISKKLHNDKPLMMQNTPNKNYGTLVISNFILKCEGLPDKQAFTLYTELSNARGDTSMKFFNVSGTFPITQSRSTRYISNTIEEDSINTVIDVTFGEILAWMISEFSSSNIAHETNTVDITSPMEGRTQPTPSQKVPVGDVDGWKNTEGL